MKDSTTKKPPGKRAAPEYSAQAKSLMRSVLNRLAKSDSDPHLEQRAEQLWMSDNQAQNKE